MFKIKNDFCRRNISRTIRFTNPLLQQLKETARQNNISLSLLVLQCCKYALDHIENASLHGQPAGRIRKRNEKND